MSVSTVTFDQFNAYLLIKRINFSKKKKIIITNPIVLLYLFMFTIMQTIDPTYAGVFLSFIFNHKYSCIINKFMLTLLFTLNSSLSDHSHHEFVRNMCSLNSFRMQCIFTYYSDKSTFTAHAGRGQSPLWLCWFMKLK